MGSAYKTYLNGEQWKTKRAKVLARDGNKCQMKCGFVATQVHHLTYERIFNERMTDLVSLCARCHESLHKLSKKNLKTVNSVLRYNLFCRSNGRKEKELKILREVICENY